MKRKQLLCRIAACIMIPGILFTAVPLKPQAAAVSYLPGVTDAMTDPAFWAANQDTRLFAGSSSQILGNEYSISDLNRKIRETKDCVVYDLPAEDPWFDGIAMEKALERSIRDDLAYFKNSGAVYDIYGNRVGDEFFAPIIANTKNPAISDHQFIQYGICTTQTDIRELPTMELLKDDRADNDFDYFQLGSVRVNEPVVIRSRSADGLWYLVKAQTCSGWVRGSDIAICRSKEEWMQAWNIPSDKVLVVTDGEIYLEYSNNNPDISGKLLTMGTTLRLAEDWEYTGKVTNRSSYQNYAAWMPLRDPAGFYSRKVVLISQNKGVHAGYLPLTTENILRTAFSMLGDAYGWGSMLNSADCAAYVRAVYKCFGLELAHNTTRQAAMPVVKCDLSAFPQDASGDIAKKALLDTLPAGSILYFSGHAMIYLGKVDDQYYVVSSVSSMADPDTGRYLRVRSVVINSLDVKRLSGKTWMNCLNCALIPYLAQ